MKTKRPKRCDRCRRFFARYRCNAPGECDCPRCQGMCGCEVVDEVVFPKDDDVRQAEERVEAGQARWASTGSTRRL